MTVTPGPIDDNTTTSWATSASQRADLLSHEVITPGISMNGLHQLYAAADLTGDIPAPAGSASVTIGHGFEGNAHDWGGFGFAWDPIPPLDDLGISIDDETLMATNLDWDSLIHPTYGQETGRDIVSVTESAPTGRSQSYVLSGHEAFKRSIWLWEPDPRDSATNEEAPQLTEGEEQVLLSPEHIDPTAAEIYSLALGNKARDALLVLVQKHSGPNVAVRSFPSAKMLGLLLKFFVAWEKSSCCPIVHVPSLALETSRMELLSAMIVAGCTSYGIRQVWKLGLALQERTRLAIYRALDCDNSLARDLEFFQAQILWIESGLWSGSSRKAEVAESAANNTPTVSLFSVFKFQKLIALDDTTSRCTPSQLL